MSLGNFAKPIAILAGGVLVLFMGLSSFSGRETEIEHLYAGETVTATCRDGKPHEGEGLHMNDAITKCAEEQRSQRNSTRLLFLVGLGLVGWGAFALHKAR